MVTTAIDAEAAYKTFLPAAQALSPSAVRPYRLDPDLAIVNVQTALPAIVALKNQIPSHLPQVDLPALLSIADLAVAVKFADLRAEQAVPSEKGVNESLKKARAIRRVLLSVAKGLEESSLVPHDEVEAIVKGSGNRDIAEDCVSLADLFRQHEAHLAGKHPITKDQIDEAAAVGSWLLAHMRTETSPAEKAGPKAPEVDVRDRLGTLLWNVYGDLRKVAYYFHGDGFEEIAPPLQSRSQKRVKKEEPPT